MKPFVFLFSILLSLSVAAQITIDKDDLPQPGQEYQRSTGTSATLDVNITGPNTTWDYSDLERSSTDTLIYNTVGQTPLFYQFQFNSPLSPNYQATEAQFTEDIDLGGFISMTNNYLFSKTETNSWSEVGIGTTVSGVPLPTKYDDIKTKLNLPIQFGDQNTDTYAYEISVPAFGTIGQEGTLTYEVDGWGALTTPGGTFQTLRVKTTTEKSDTIYINLLSMGLRIPSTEVKYEWYASNEGFPVLTVTEQLGMVTSAVYKDDPLLSIANAEPALITKVYPNPAIDVLNIESPFQNLEVEICDLSGKSMKKIEALSTTSLDISSLPSGVYLLKSTSGTHTEWARFIKN